jgi:hypothetical protein
MINKNNLQIYDKKDWINKFNHSNHSPYFDFYYIYLKMNCVAIYGKDKTTFHDNMRNINDINLKNDVHTEGIKITIENEKITN